MLWTADDTGGVCLWWLNLDTASTQTKPGAGSGAGGGGGDGSIFFSSSQPSSTLSSPPKGFVPDKKRTSISSTLSPNSPTTAPLSPLAHIPKVQVDLVKRWRSTDEDVERGSGGVSSLVMLGTDALLDDPEKSPAMRRAGGGGGGGERGLRGLSQGSHTGSPAAARAGGSRSGSPEGQKKGLAGNAPPSGHLPTIALIQASDNGTISSWDGHDGYMLGKMNIAGIPRPEDEEASRHGRAKGIKSHIPLVDGRWFVPIKPMSEGAQASRSTHHSGEEGEKFLAGLADDLREFVPPDTLPLVPFGSKNQKSPRSPASKWRSGGSVILALGTHAMHPLGQSAAVGAAGGHLEEGQVEEVYDPIVAQRAKVRANQLLYTMLDGSVPSQRMLEQQRREESKRSRASRRRQRQEGMIDGSSMHGSIGEDSSYGGTSYTGSPEPRRIGGAPAPAGAAAGGGGRKPYAAPASDEDDDDEEYSRSNFVSKLRMARSESMTAMEATRGREATPSDKSGGMLQVGMGNDGENDGFRSPALSPKKSGRRATISEEPQGLMYNQAQMSKKEERRARASTK